VHASKRYLEGNPELMAGGKVKKNAFIVNHS
jgi:hypothetical protein